MQVTFRIIITIALLLLVMSGCICTRPAINGPGANASQGSVPAPMSPGLKDSGTVPSNKKTDMSPAVKAGGATPGPSLPKSGAATTGP